MSRRLAPGEAERLRVLPRLELQRQHAHADQVAAVDALVALGDHRAHAQQQRALGRPVARGAGAVLLAREHDQRHAFGAGTARRRRRSSCASPAGRCSGDAALDAGHQQVLEADVGERAAHHHPVVAAARAVGVEVRLGRRRCDFRKRAGRAVLARCRRRARCGRWSPSRRAWPARARPRMSVERRAAPASGPGRTAAPGCRSTRSSKSKRSPSRHRDRVPGRVAVEDVAVGLAEHLARRRWPRAPRTSSCVGQMSRRIDRLAVAVRAERLGRRGRCRSCRPARRRPPAAARPGSWPSRRGLMRPSKLRLPESTAEATSLPSLTALRDRLGQRAAVADAGRAAVADRVEAERLEVRR